MWNEECKLWSTLRKVLLSPHSDSLRAGRSGDRIPVEGEIFRTRPDLPWAHPVSYTVGTGSLPGVKRPGRGVYHPPHLAPRLKKDQSSASTPSLGLLWGELYLTFTYTLRTVLMGYGALSLGEEPNGLIFRGENFRWSFCFRIWNWTRPCFHGLFPPLRVRPSRPVEMSDTTNPAGGAWR